MLLLHSPRVQTQNGSQHSPEVQATHPDPFNHEADVSDAHEVCGLVNGVYGLYVAGDLQRKAIV